MNTVYTIGHSTHPLSEFIDILSRFDIKAVADVRTLPRSRHVPQYNQESLAVSLAEEGIDYRHFPGLGGLRHPSNDSLNTGWRNASFRGYADYMQTCEFRKNLEQLMHLAENKVTVIMCAEAVPWRCHRSLIGDALLIRGVPVIDIITSTSIRTHRLTPWAQVNGYAVSYPSPAEDSKPKTR